MKTIITIQHTQSIHHTNGMVGSWTDWDLSDVGKRQANNIGKKLSKELQGTDFTLFSSDLARARQTAEIVGSYLNRIPIVKQELRERNLGRCVGKSVAWLRQNMEYEEKTIDDRMFSDAESRRDEWNRLFPFFKEITTNDKKNIIIVSHGDLLSVFHTMWIGAEVESLNKLEFWGLSGGVSFMCQNDDGKRFVKRLNDMSYILDE